MSGNTDTKKISDDLAFYQDQKAFAVKKCNHLFELGDSKKNIHFNWLWEMGEMQYDPEDRAIAIMPLVIWEISKGYLTPEMEGELYGSKKDMDDGLLDGYPKDMFEAMKNDIEECIEIYERDIEPKQNRKR